MFHGFSNLTYVKWSNIFIKAYCAFDTLRNLRLVHLCHCSILQINRYANQCQNRENRSTHARSTQWKPVNHQEMRAFFGLVMAMGIVKKTSIESYWETSGITETEHFRDVMPRNRFQSILRYLHCSDNETAIPRGQAGYDPLHKISPVVDFFNEVFEKKYRLDT